MMKIKEGDGMISNLSAAGYVITNLTGKIPPCGSL